MSHFWKAFTKKLKIETRYSTSFHLETDGQTERANQELEQYLRLNLLDHEGEWSDYLWAAEFTHNNAKNSSTGYSPFFLNSGRHPNLSVNIQEAEVPAVTDLVEHLTNIHQSATENLVKAKKDYKF